MQKKKKIESEVQNLYKGNLGFTGYFKFFKPPERNRIPFFKWGNWSSESPSNLPKGPELVNIKGKIWTLVILAQSRGSLAIDIPQPPLQIL